MASLTQAKLGKLITAFRTARVLVIGDIVLDRFIWGAVSRISPEAPVPVVEVARRSTVLGGAANVAHNIVALGGKATLLGVIGRDHAGSEVLDACHAVKIAADGVVRSGNRPTTVKTRVIAHNQQVVRFDEESTNSIRAATEKKIIAQIETAAKKCTAIAVSDYGKGVVTHKIMDAVRAAADARGIPVLVDPKPPARDVYRGAAVFKPNAREAGEYAGVQLSTESAIAAWAKTFCEEMDIDAVLVTRGEAGMTLVERGAKPYTEPTRAREVFDVSGAGDTVLAALALATASGASLKESVALANRAAGVVIGKLGVATVSPDELSI